MIPHANFAMPTATVALSFSMVRTTLFANAIALACLFVGELTTKAGTMLATIYMVSITGTADGKTGAANRTGETNKGEQLTSMSAF